MIINASSNGEKPSQRSAKYIKYAVGEILLVVIGILIALQINNWSEEQKQRALEKLYLSELQSDLKKDSTVISQMIQKSNTQLIAKAELLKFLEENTSYNISASGALKRYIEKNKIQNIHLDSLVSYFRRQWLPSYSFAPNKTTFDEMKSTGNLRVIKNRELKRLLLETYNAYEYHKLNEEFIYNRQQNEFWRLIFQRIPGIYHLKNEDIPDIFKDHELLNRMEGNYVHGINEALIDLQAVNRKLLNQLSIVNSSK